MEEELEATTGFLLQCKKSLVLGDLVTSPASWTLVAWKGRYRKSWCSSSREVTEVTAEKP